MYYKDFERQWHLMSSAMPVTVIVFKIDKKSYEEALSYTYQAPLMNFIITTRDSHLEKRNGDLITSAFL